MLLLAASHISNSYNVYNCNYIIQVFLVLKLFKNMQIHIIQVHTDTYYSSLLSWPENQGILFFIFLKHFK